MAGPADEPVSMPLAVAFHYLYAWVALNVSKNKARMTKEEREYVGLVKMLPCSVRRRGRATRMRSSRGNGGRASLCVMSAIRTRCLAARPEAGVADPRDGRTGCPAATVQRGWSASCRKCA